MSILSAKVAKPTTAEAWLQDTLAGLQKDDPNAGYCSASGIQAFKVPNGPNGAIVAMCYTYTPSGGEARKQAFIQVGGVDKAGTTLFIIDIIARVENIKEVADAADPIVATITWKLYKP
jgi:hypothetical protein